MSKQTMIEKPSCKLFEDISVEDYNKAFRLLEKLRDEHRGPHGYILYRDDELLMHVLCRIINIVDKL